MLSKTEVNIGIIEWPGGSRKENLGKVTQSRGGLIFPGWARVIGEEEETRNGWGRNYLVSFRTVNRNCRLISRLIFLRDKAAPRRFERK